MRAPRNAGKDPGRRATRSAVAALLFLAALAPAGAAAPQAGPFEARSHSAPGNRIDQLVFGRLKELGIRPARPCSDAVFLRRVHLDVIGTLPTPREARAFLRDRDPERRAALIDRLLERGEFADYQAMRWCDLLRVKAEFPINLWPNAVQAYHRWIRTGIAENTPYDRFARELLTSSGSCFRVPPVNFYRALQGSEPEAIARAVALTFMGSRAEGWPPERQAGLTAFFSQVGYKSTAEWKEEIVFFDAGGAAGTPPGSAVFPDGTPASIPAGKDPRAVFADWLIAPENPWFARCAANRVWGWLQGRGIVHEPDDFREDNPPSHPELLAFLERELIEARFDLKHLYRLILSSRTYQLSSIPRSDDPRAEALFAWYSIRRLEAEVLIDALCQITGTSEEYTSAIPEPFTFVPEGQRAIQLSDGSISSSFLEMFGRPPRDTGLSSERDDQPTAAQRLHLLNSSHVRDKLEKSRELRAQLSSAGGPGGFATRLYLLILSRHPTREELDAVRAYVESGAASRREVAVDVAWALINSAEFLYRH